MSTKLVEDHITVLDVGGRVVIPPHVLDQSHLEAGDIISIMSVADEVVVIRKASSSKSALEMLKELGTALREAGYDTQEKIDHLVDEVKLEVTNEWLTKEGIHLKG
jgi:bifunctional DNA-binding transcriptional regulator/antitoxin component of YhaV-PrlF toxin-antitoxin module